MKKLLSTLCCFALLTATAEAKTFSDVPSTAWYYPFVTEMSSGGFVSGTSTSTYDPEGSLTLAGFCTMISNGFYGETLAEEKWNSSNAWWEPYMNAVYLENGLDRTNAAVYYRLNQTWGNYPDSDINRYEMASIVMNLLKNRDFPELTQAAISEICSGFSDLVAEEHAEAVAMSVQFGFLEGRSNGNFGGLDNLSRAEAAVVLCGLVNSEEVWLDEVANYNTPPESGNDSNNNSDSNTGGNSNNNTGGNSNNSDSNTTTPDQSTDHLEEYVKDVFYLVNEARTSYGLAPFTLDTTLCTLAQYKTDEMSALNYLDHTSPTYGAFSNILGMNGIYASIAKENLAKGQRSPEEVVEAWLGSTDHRNNILSTDVGKLGIGFTEDGYYWSQLFTDSAANTGSDQYTGDGYIYDGGDSTVTKDDYCALFVPLFTYVNYINVGYDYASTSIEIPLQNTGTLLLHEFSYSLSGADADLFVLTEVPDSISVGATSKLTVQPISGLGVGSYTVTVNVQAHDLPLLQQSVSIFVV